MLDMFSCTFGEYLVCRLLKLPTMAEEEVTDVDDDNGSSMCEDGFAGDDAPHALFPSIVDEPKIIGTMDKKDFYVREEAERKRGVSAVNTDNDSGMYKPGYSGDDDFPCVVGVSGTSLFSSFSSRPLCRIGCRVRLGCLLSGFQSESREDLSLSL